MRALKAALAYFAIVFAVGFALGVVRELWVKPLIGARGAEMAEVPLMVGISILAALWVVRRHALRRSVLERLGVGVMALVMLIAAELLVVTLVRGQTIARYLESRDPMSLVAYLAGLLLFALMPALTSGALGARRHRRRGAYRQ